MPRPVGFVARSRKLVGLARNASCRTWTPVGGLRRFETLLWAHGERGKQRDTVRSKASLPGGDWLLANAHTGGVHQRPPRPAGRAIKGG